MSNDFRQLSIGCTGTMPLYKFINSIKPKYFADLSLSSWQLQLWREQDGVYERVCCRLQCDQVKVQIQLNSFNSISVLSIVFAFSTPDIIVITVLYCPGLCWTTPWILRSCLKTIASLLCSQVISYLPDTIITIGDSKVVTLVTCFTSYYRGW